MNEETHSRTDAQTDSMDRREAIEMLGVGGMAAYGVHLTPRERFDLRPGDHQGLRFFTSLEASLVRILADMIIPRDERSGSATDSGAIEYMDFVLAESSERTRTQWHEGLNFFDNEARSRFQRGFAALDEAQRGMILDDIAWPARATAEFAAAAAFFNRVRDLTAAAFFSSRMGVEDLRYMGGVVNPDWNGAPPEALAELGLSYAEWDAKYGRRR